jgi:hypothetical protein
MDNPTILIVGLGDLGGHVLEFLARVPHQKPKSSRRSSIAGPPVSDESKDRGPRSRRIPVESNCWAEAISRGKRRDWAC